MKVFWQQLLGFSLIIVIAIMLFAFRIERQISDNLIDSREQQLLNYGNNIVNNNFSRYDLVRTSQLLARENISIQVYLSDGRIIYPTYDQRYQSSLTQEELAKLQSGNYLGFRSVERQISDHGTETYLMVYLPHQDVGEFPSGFISLAAPLNDLEEQLHSLRVTIAVSLSISLIIGGALSAFYSNYSTRKIRRLQEATQQIGQGNFDVVLDTSSHDEYGDLARDFDSMTQSLIASQEEIKRQEELRRQFMMDVAHEMRTPLTTMSGLLEGLIHKVIPEHQQDRSLKLIEQETHRLTRLVNENLDYEKIRSRQIVLKKQSINGVALFEQIQTQLSEKAAQKNDTILTQAAEDLVIWGDYDRIVQVLINLVTNAIQFSQGSDIILHGSMHSDYSEMIVEDFGIGIDPDEVNRIWERFYKADVSRKNTEFGESGIGLAIVQSIIETHDGQIFVESKKGEGTRFIIHLPHQETTKGNQ